MPCFRISHLSTTFYRKKKSHSLISFLLNLNFVLHIYTENLDSIKYVLICSINRFDSLSQTYKIIITQKSMLKKNSANPYSAWYLFNNHDLFYKINREKDKNRRKTFESPYSQHYNKNFEFIRQKSANQKSQKEQKFEVYLIRVCHAQTFKLNPVSKNSLEQNTLWWER